jgi:uncharacterized damage-inducible protein DinB
MSYGAKDLAESFRTVRKNTVQVAEDIPEDKYGFKAAADIRSVEKLLTHIALSTRFPYQVHAVEKRTNMEGFDFGKLMQEFSTAEEKSRTKAEVIELLKSEGETWARFIEGLPDDALQQMVQLPKGATPPAKSRFEMFLSVKEHEMHHRGQLMLIERMVGIVPHLTRQMQARMAEFQERGGKR